LLLLPSYFFAFLLWFVLVFVFYASSYVCVLEACCLFVCVASDCVVLLMHCVSFDLLFFFKTVMRRSLSLYASIDCYLFPIALVHSACDAHLESFVIRSRGYCVIIAVWGRVGYMTNAIEWRSSFSIHADSEDSCSYSLQKNS
jgi:hypothetical protein